MLNAYKYKLGRSDIAKQIQADKEYNNAETYKNLSVYDNYEKDIDKFDELAEITRQRKLKELSIKLNKPIEELEKDEEFAPLINRLDRVFPQAQITRDSREPFQPNLDDRIPTYNDIKRLLGNFTDEDFKDLEDISTALDTLKNNPNLINTDREDVANILEAMSKKLIQLDKKTSNYLRAIHRNLALLMNETSEYLKQEKGRIDLDEAEETMHAMQNLFFPDEILDQIELGSETETEEEEEDEYYSVEEEESYREEEEEKGEDLREDTIQIEEEEQEEEDTIPIREEGLRENLIEQKNPYNSLELTKTDIRQVNENFRNNKYNTVEFLPDLNLDNIKSVFSKIDDRTLDFDQKRAAKTDLFMYLFTNLTDSEIKDNKNTLIELINGLRIRGTRGEGRDRDNIKKIRVYINKF